MSITNSNPSQPVNGHGSNFIHHHSSIKAETGSNGLKGDAFQQALHMSNNVPSQDQMFASEPTIANFDSSVKDMNDKATNVIKGLTHGLNQVLNGNEVNDIKEENKATIKNYKELSLEEVVQLIGKKIKVVGAKSPEAEEKLIKQFIEIVKKVYSWRGMARELSIYLRYNKGELILHTKGTGTADALTKESGSFNSDTENLTLFLSSPKPIQDTFPHELSHAVDTILGKHDLEEYGIEYQSGMPVTSPLSPFSGLDEEWQKLDNSIKKCEESLSKISDLAMTCAYNKPECKKLREIVENAFDNEIASYQFTGPLLRNGKEIAQGYKTGDTYEHRRFGLIKVLDNDQKSSVKLKFLSFPGKVFAKTRTALESLSGLQQILAGLTDYTTNSNSPYKEVLLIEKSKYLQFESGLREIFDKVCSDLDITINERRENFIKSKGSIEQGEAEYKLGDTRGSANSQEL